MLLRNLLSRIDKKSVKAKAMNTKQSKMLTNLQIMVEELNEYNEVKVESRRQAQQRLVQSLRMHVAHAFGLADRGVWLLRDDHTKWQLNLLKNVKNARGKTVKDYHKLIFQNV